MNFATKVTEFLAKIEEFLYEAKIAKFAIKALKFAKRNWIRIAGLLFVLFLLYKLGFWATLILSVVAAPFWVIWRYKWSIRVVPLDFVALATFLGKPEVKPDPDNPNETIPIIYQSGKAFVPYCFGQKWDGHDPWELSFVPTDMFKLKYEGSEDHKIWSSDKQILIIEASAYIRFPYNDAKAIVLILKSKVPLDEDGLTEWAEEEIMSVVRDVMADFDYQTAISHDQLAKINIAANKLLEKPESLFCKTGVCGEDPAVRVPGLGEVSIKIEKILLTPKLQAQLESQQTASLGIQIAGSEADQEGIRVGGPIDRMMDRWVAGEIAKQPGVLPQDVIKELKSSGEYAKQRQTYKDLILAKGGNLKVNRIEPTNPDGTPLSGNLGPIGAFAAILGRDKQ